MLGMARLGTARLGTARLGEARQGLGCIRNDYRHQRAWRDMR